jgi:hypothetical protein
VRSEFDERRESLGPHGEIVAALGSGDESGLAGAMIHDQGDDGEREDGSDDGHGVEAVDAPFLDDVFLEEGEEGGAGEADFGGLQGEPIAFGEGEDGDERVADDADDGDGDVDLAGVLGFVEADGREDGVAAVVDCAAVEFFGDGAGRGGGGILVVDTEGERGIEDAGECEKSDEEAHVGFIVRAWRREIRMGRGFRRRPNVSGPV